MEGIAAALTIPSNIMSDLEKAQELINKMSQSSDKIVKDFASFANHATSINKSLNEIKVDKVFDTKHIDTFFERIAKGIEGASRNLGGFSKDIQNLGNEVSKGGGSGGGSGKNTLAQRIENALTLPESTVSEVSNKIRKISSLLRSLETQQSKKPSTDTQEIINNLKDYIKALEAVKQRLVEARREQANFEKQARRVEALNAKIGVIGSRSNPDSLSEAKSRYREVKKILEELQYMASQGIQAVKPEDIQRAEELQNKLRGIVDGIQTSNNDKHAKELNDKINAAITLPESTVSDVSAKIRRITSLVTTLKAEQAKDPSKSAYANEIKNLNEIISRLKQQKDRLIEIQREQRALAQAADDVAKANDRIGFMSSRSDPKDLGDAKRRYREILEIYEKLKYWKSKGIGGVTQDDIDKAEKLKKKYEGIIGKFEAAGEASDKAGNLFNKAFDLAIITKFTKKLIEIRGEFEIQERTLAAIINSEADAAKMFARIQQMAIKSPFSVLDMSKQAKQLAAYRIEADKLLDTTKMLGDISAGVGVDMNRLILAYGQVKATTWLKGTELRQFSEAGVNLVGGLSEYFSNLYGRVVSVGEVMQMVSKKMVRFEDVDAVLQKMTSFGGTFYQMQEKQANTIRGQIVNLQDRWEIALNEIGESTQGIIYTVVKALQFLLDNWKVISAAINAGLVAIIAHSLLLPAKVSEIKKAFTILNQTIKLFTSTTGGWVGIFAIVATAIASFVFQANKFKREIKEIAQETSKAIREAETEYKRLTEIINSSNIDIEARKDALSQLKQEYGNIIDLQGVDLSNLDKLNKSYELNISLIKESLRLKQMEKAYAKVVEELAETEAKRTLALYNTVNEVRAKTGKSYKDLSLISKDVIHEIQLGIENSILNNEITTGEEAAIEFWKQLGTYIGLSEDKLSEFIVLAQKIGGATLGFSDPLNSRAYTIESDTLSQFDDVLDMVNQVKEAYRTVDIDVSFTLKAQKFLNDIKGLKNFISDYESYRPTEEGGVLTRKELFKQNPQQLRTMAEEEMRKAGESIEEGIENAIANGALEPEMEEPLKKALATALANAADSGVDLFLRNVQQKVNTKFPKLKIPIGTAEITKSDNETIDDHIKEIENMIESRRKELFILEIGKSKRSSTDANLWTTQFFDLVNQWSGNALAEGAIDKAESVLTMQIDALVMYLKMLGISFKKLEGSGNLLGSKKYSSRLKEYIMELKRAAKEFDILDDEGDKLLKSKLDYQAKQLGLTPPISYDEATVMAWLKTVQNKISKEDQIEVGIAFNKDATEEAIRKLRGNITELWDKYDTAKKFSDWGIIFKGFDANQILGDIEKVEGGLKKINTEASLQAAEDSRKKRAQIARKEQEDAAKIIYEAQKKSLTKVEQAYATMYENINKMIKDSNDESLDTVIPYEQIGLGVNAQIKKSLKDVADAQWEAYRATEMYAMAFGNLDDMGVDVLTLMRADLDAFAKSGSVSGKELRDIHRQIKLIDATINEKGATDGLFAAVSSAFGDISKAKKAYGEAVELQSAVAKASKEKNDAQKKEDELLQEYIDLIERQYQIGMELQDLDEIIENSEDVTDTNEAQERRNSLLEEYAEVNNKAVKVEKEHGKAIKDNKDKQDKLDDAVSDYNDKLKEARAYLDKSKKKIDGLSDSYSKLTAPITEAISMVQDFASTLGITFSDETQAAVDGFVKGIALVGSVLAFVSTTLVAIDAIVKALNKDVAITMSMLTPLLVIAVAVGATIAAISFADAQKKKRVEDLKNEVEQLTKAYALLEEQMSSLIDHGDLYATFNKQLSNIQMQRSKLKQAIFWEEQRGTKADGETIADLKEQLNDLDSQADETKKTFLETFGAISNYQDAAKEWSSSWLQAFKEGKSGLRSLGESFDAFYEDLVVGQLFSSGKMAAFTKELKDTIEAVLKDGYITEDEAKEIRDLRTRLKEINSQLYEDAERMGITSPSESSENGLQKGIESITEDTALSIESYLNSMRFFVADSNSILGRIEAILNGSSQGDGNPIVNELKTQTRLLSRLAGAVTPNGQSLSVVMK